MIRVVLFLIAVALIAVGAVWFADRPGDVVIAWLGYRIETSVMVLVAAVLTLVVITVLAWSLLRGLIRSPRAIADYVRTRRTARAHVAITRGLVAIGSGDVRAARRFAGEARRLAADEPLALLLSAQTAQLSGDQASAERTFREMASRRDTKLLGLHGLFVEAQRRNDAAAARALAEDAVRADPSLGWAAQAVLEFRCVAHEWTGALAALDSNMKTGLLDKAAYRRQRAVLLAGRALARDGDLDREGMRAAVLEAVKLAPDLVPAAALAARLLAEDGEIRKAARVIEAAWRANPHPDLAETYAYLKSGESARERLGRVQALARLVPDDPEGALAVARAAIDARELVVARTALAPLLEQPTRRVAVLMAEIEETDAGDVGRAREWMARALRAARDPGWTADGLVSDRWMPVSPVTGRLDAFQWRVPVADLTPSGPVIDDRRPEAPPQLQQPAVPEPPPDVAAPAPRTNEGAVATPARGSRPEQGAANRPVESVIPLVHVPDDPGPEPDPDVVPLGGPPRERWGRLRSVLW